MLPGWYIPEHATRVVYMPLITRVVYMPLITRVVYTCFPRSEKDTGGERRCAEYPGFKPVSATF